MADMSNRKKQEQRIEEYLHNKYGRLQIGPHNIIRIVFNVHNVAFFFGGGGYFIAL